ncbi:MAG: CRISPR-associated protein Cas5 [Gemmiger formicilis]|uniref:CRISPR-associated protein Cas5 n=1 Tax=Gemmiger formicilis TaxID=745368 RepID=UPI0039928594
MQRSEVTPPYVAAFKWDRRAASPLAAAEGSRPLPTKQTVKGAAAQACGPGMPGPYRAVKEGYLSHERQIPLFYFAYR